jgi:hypothetical protein
VGDPGVKIRVVLGEIREVAARALRAAMAAKVE